ncbi:haloalkane dehalogenase [Paraburkholderia sp. ZP32-5]|uniref:haloalkane dehalogenase n=1 Tax=Paraburkholderia sp. ZP32-5 TaxID=2883245 RepID=UPI001F3CB48D|nr:haloalkane dehalogenase [Paraburkholderia sp. ZP32-5]
MSIAALRTPEERFRNLPGWSFAPRYIDTLPGYQGLRMHYIDEGPSNAEVTFLCIHGTPSWSYLYRKMIPVFVAHGHRVVALDLFGFGRSDKPADDLVYRYHFHRDSIRQFIEHLDLKNVCLVGQDWGGILGLSLIKDMSERFSRLFLMNTSLPHGEEPTPGFDKWRAENRSRHFNPVGDWIGSRTPVLSAEERAAYDAPFPDASYQGGVRRFPELIMRPENGVLSDAAKEGLETSVAARKFLSEQWQGESFMAIGMQDVVITPERMEQLRQVIRGCNDPYLVQDAGHYVQEWGEPIALEGLRRFGLLATN